MDSDGSYISARFLKEVAESIAAPLTKLCNKSLDSYWYHSKCSNVTPVHKGGIIQTNFCSSSGGKSF